MKLTENSVMLGFTAMALTGGWLAVLLHYGIQHEKPLPSYHGIEITNRFSGSLSNVIWANPPGTGYWHVTLTNASGFTLDYDIVQDGTVCLDKAMPGDQYILTWVKTNEFQGAVK